MGNLVSARLPNINVLGVHTGTLEGILDGGLPIRRWRDQLRSFGFR